jgi:hypothetical protein
MTMGEPSTPPPKRDDADARGEHMYGSDEPDSSRRGSTKNPLTRGPGYAAGEGGTQTVTPPTPPDRKPSGGDPRDQ